MSRRSAQVQAPVLAALHAACFPPGSAWTEAAFADLLASPGVFACVDAAGGFILARTAGDEAEVLTLAVIPGLRRGGRGAALVRAALARAGDAGARLMFLEVARDNLPARALYAQAGFAEIGVRRRYYPDGTDALLLRRPVAAPEQQPGETARVRF